MIESPFAVLTAVAAPAILTNACSVLALGTSNRVARVVDQTRVVIAALNHEPPDGARRKSRIAHIERMGRRAHLLLNALRIIYAALGGFAAAALLSVVGALGVYYGEPPVYQAAAALALVAGVSAVAALVTGCVLMVTETRLALLSVHQQIEDALGLQP